MIRFLHIILISFVGFSMIQSCSIQKRKYTRGWHITPKKINRVSSGIKPKSIESPKKIESSESSKKSIKKPSTVDLSSKIFEEINNSNSSKIDPTNDSNIEDSPQMEMHQQSIQQRALSQKSESNPEALTHPESDETTSWVAKMFGGILGVLLALILLVPFFLIVVFLLSGDEDDALEFNTSSSDSPFVHAFKRSFNVVFKIGVIVLIWSMIILGVILLLVFLYVNYGVIGVILGIIVIVLIFWLLYVLLEKFFEFIFPGYRR